MEERKDRRMETVRKPFQGVSNIVRFNWHFYVIAGLVLVGLLLFSTQVDDSLKFYLRMGLMLLFLLTISSLLVSYYIYDSSGLYKLSWLNNKIKNSDTIVNIHAGFDETSELLQNKFGNTILTVFDFYNPEQHTEISIKRARKAYPPFPTTQSVNTSKLPLDDNTIGAIFVLLSAHEIREEAERIVFFKELYRVLAVDGQVIITEHLRDAANFLAYTIGFFHFHSRKTWLKTFTKSGFTIQQEMKITPFITTFILEKHGTAS